LITYRTGNQLDLDQVIGLYRSCSLGARRPVDDRERMGRMLANANLVVTAWEEELLVGISRSISFPGSHSVTIISPSALERIGAF